MPTLHLLGTGAGFSDGRRTTTMLAVHDAGSTLVVDCGGDAVQRLQAQGVDLATVDALFITHEHPDHVAGFPLFMEKIWLSGRKRPVPVVGIAAALAQARRCWEAFRTEGWDVPEMQWRETEHREGAVAWEDRRWRVTVAPGVHSVPVVGLRVESPASGRVLAYSADTERCEPITRLAHGAHLLVHEATGTFPGHASAADAARVAAEANAGRLVLVHLPPGADDGALAEARTVYAATEYGSDGESLDY